MNGKIHSYPALGELVPVTQGESEKLYLLSLNHGFSRLSRKELERWRQYVGWFEEVRRVPVQAVAYCPDCQSARWMPFGQRVYYHSLITLRECVDCRLLYTDGIINPAAISLFFEDSYKSEDYFWCRRLIFEHLARLATAHLPEHGAVLDIGGASGHLLEMIHTYRPNAQLALSDISKEACRRAREKIPGLCTIACTLAELDPAGERYDVVIASDVIYYEHEARKTWKNLCVCLKPSGTLILRMPNKFWLIRLVQYARSHWRFAYKQRTDVEMPFFNSEHVLLMSRRYLDKRLRSIGFQSVEFLPSPTLNKRGFLGFLGRVGYGFSGIVNRLTGHVITPGMVVVASNLSH